jgi:uncharacterized protein (DUF58 family)
MGALFCLIVGYGAGLMELIYAASFLAVLPLSSLVLVRMRRRRLSVVRTFSPIVASAGAPVTVELEVRNLSASASSSASWTDHIPWHPGTTGAGALPVLSGALPGYLNPRAAAQVRYTLRPPTRGVFPIGPLEIEYGDPFGLRSPATARPSSPATDPHASCSGDHPAATTTSSHANTAAGMRCVACTGARLLVTVN